MPSRKRYTKTLVIAGISTMLLYSNVVMAASSILNIGSEGSNVSELQEQLKNSGFYKYSQITGYYGEITKNAVLSFQKSKGLNPDGIAGPSTLSALEFTYSDTEAGTSRGSEYSFRLTRALKKGMQGHDVEELQKILKSNGYYNYAVDGDFGSKTENAVKVFQKSAGIENDGVVGPATVSKLNKDSTISKNGSLSDRSASSRESDGKKQAVEMLDWSKVDKLFERKSTARVTDVDTEKSFMVYRLGGTLHADVEPLTAKDTAVMKEIYGGLWSWNRRAIIVEIDGKRIAASMNGMPHGDQDIYNNSFDGQFCIHFLGSKVHQSGKEDADHQAMVKKAANVN